MVKALSVFNDISTGTPLSLSTNLTIGTRADDITSTAIGIPSLVKHKVNIRRFDMASPSTFIIQISMSPGNGLTIEHRISFSENLGC